MGLKGDLLDAKIRAAMDVGLPPPDVSEGSYAEREAHYSARAIINAMRDANFTITQLKAPVIVEELRTPSQPVNVKLDTLLGEYQPVLKLLKKIGSPLGLSKVIDSLEGEIEKAITPLLEGGADMIGLDINKNAGGLQSTGYVYIGEDPDSQGSFDVEDEDGQRQFTTVKLLKEDARKII
mgnify:CR=1 FL=1|tara:strand:+ start:1675 stop:2214 length:540 start_codon:yes stop_codon:yes gene_type:complete